MNDNVVQISRKRRTEQERTIIFGGALAGLSLWEINQALANAGYRELHPRSYHHLKTCYVPYFKADMSRLPGAIKHPPSMGMVADEKRRTA